MKRNTLKGWITTTGMILVLAVGTFANGGVTVNGLNSDDTRVNCGILIGDLGGILIGDFGGILIGDLVGTIVKGISKENPCEERVNSGILIGD